MEERAEVPAGTQNSWPLKGPRATSGRAMESKASAARIKCSLTYSCFSGRVLFLGLCIFSEHSSFNHKPWGQILQGRT